MNFISIIIFIALSLICGVGLIGMSLDIYWASIQSPVDSLEFLIQDPLGRVTVFLLGALIVLVMIRFVQNSIVKARRVKTLKIDTAEGQISITLSALEDMIKKALSGDENISHIRPRVHPTKKGINVTVKLGLKTETSVKEFAEDTQEKIKEKMQNILGREKELKINIEVRKIVFDRKGQVVEEDLEEEEEGPFRKYN